LRNSFVEKGTLMMMQTARKRVSVYRQAIGTMSAVLALCAFANVQAAETTDLPLYEPERLRTEKDWLVDDVGTESGVFRTENENEIVLTNGLISRTFRLKPNAATVAFDNLVTGESVIRGIKPEGLVEIDGVPHEIGGLKGQPNYAFLRPEWVDPLKADPAAFQFVGFQIGKPKERFAWKRVRHHAPNVKWPPKGISLQMDYHMPASTETLTGSAPRRSEMGRTESIVGEFKTFDRDASEIKRAVRVTVHYELYDGIPCMSKWITVHNGSDKRITVNRFTSEILAAVEHTSRVQGENVYYPPPNILVETDYAFQGMDPETVTRFSVHWVKDREYKTQVSYSLTTPCLLEVRPSVGPEQDLAPGKTFESFRAFIMPYDSTDRERQGLSRRRMYRTIAPWTTENPLMMHARFADWERVKRAIDQCAEVGFEMVILTFGSGFNIEDDRPAYVEQMRQYADYARGKGIEIGGYSLLASRQIGGGNDVVSPEGRKPTYGHCPALASEWGQDYFRKLYRFYEKTGFMLLEHDGSYPGDIDVTPRPPLQKGEKDSRWVQWRIITEFYKWCRKNGIYLNVPDYYYLCGSNKNAMGYREVNWSLPRAQQVIHTRQNVFDGTWTKYSSMGWMFVPLTEYHGGGAAATIEPLHEHLDHYEQMLVSNLGAGVQACYRGPRLYDTEETKALVKKWVDWYKRHRDVLGGDLIHLRRADGRDIDYMLHVNPGHKEKGLLAVWNPLNETVSKTITVPLYYTGLTDKAMIREGGEQASEYTLDRRYRVRLEAEVPAKGFTWFVIE